MLFQPYHKKKMIFPLLVATCALWFSSLAVANAEEIVYNWHLESVLGNEFSPDCQNVQQLRRWLFLAKEVDEDGEELSRATMPGPLLEATEGDTIVLRVTNKHPVLGATLHFHGIHQIGTPWEDGPLHITQCSLNPFQTQEYRFEAYPPGTHYWHAHAGIEIADGLTGPFIVHPKTAPESFSYDEDRIMFLQDFYSETSEQQRAGLDNFPFTWIGNPDSLLINGKGLAPACIPPEDGTGAPNPSLCLVTCNETLAWIPTIEVEASKTYRFRIINSAQLAMQNVAIVGHDMTIVEVEGTIVDPPITVSNYDIAPGQRVSVLVTTDQTPGTYMIETTVRGRNIAGLTARAFLHYASTELTLPSVLPEHPATYDDFDAAKAVDDSLNTLQPEEYPEFVALKAAEEDIERWVIVGTQNTLLNEEGETVQLRWAVNNVTDMHASAEPLIGRALRVALESGWPADLGADTIDVPKMPPVVWDYSGFVNDPDGPGSVVGQQGTAVIRLSKGQVFEIVLQNARALNGAAEFHPWHVHGHSFWVVGRGEGTFDPETDPASYNLVDPLLRDTAMLWPLGWTALRMVADNPGVWLFHCHLNSHLTMGMSFALVVEPELIGDPSETTPLCGMYDDKPASPSDDGDDEPGDGGWSLGVSSALLVGAMLSLLLAK